MQAIGRTPEYTQAYLNAVMQKYLDFKKGMREDQGHNVTTAITEQLISDGKRFANGEDEMLEFQKQNNIGFIQEEGNSAAAYLVRLESAIRRAQDRIRSAQSARSRSESGSRAEQSGPDASPVTQPADDDRACHFPTSARRAII